jgi:hypothetical protein
VAGGYGFGWTSHESDYRPSGGSRYLYGNDLALQAGTEKSGN